VREEVSVLRVVPDKRLERPHVSGKALNHRDLRGGEFWKAVPAFASVDSDTFMRHDWQARRTITKPKALLEANTSLSR
jgi:lysine 2,3-aminomutase